MTTEAGRDMAIAVVGASALYPGSIGGQAFWRNILDGRDFMSDVPDDHWLIDDYYDADPAKTGKIYARRGGFLPKVAFDPMAHGLPPNQLRTTDTAQILALIVAQKVLEDAASVQFGKIDKRDISVILGVASATELVGQMSARIQRPHWIKALRDMGLPESQVQEACERIEATYPEWDESTFPGLLGNVVAGRIANRFDLGGANCVVDAACASSLGAVAMAVQELQLGRSDLVITGGADALNDVFMFMCFSKTPALSPTGDCRPFSDAADGTMLGEGIGMLALRRLEDAERDGDKIYAVLRGIGAASDGRAKSIYAPRPEGQALAIRRAYEKAGYGPGDVGLVEAHGTATKAGDVAEFEGLKQAFGDVAVRQGIALGSIKSQIGHTKAAAGAASLFKAVMALHHKALPPTIKVDQPNAKLGINESPFYLNTAARPWISPTGRTRKASVSSFGFGGSNFHVTLEEYAGASTALRTSTLPAQLLLAGAPDAAGLAAAVTALKARLDTTALPALARESQLAFDPAAKRRVAVLAADADAARANLSAALDHLQKAPDAPLSLPNRLHYALGGAAPKIAFLFPGQGSQYVGMGAELAVEFDAARQAWDAAAHMAFDGTRLDQVAYPIPVFSDAERAEQTARLTRTEWAQPAIGATSLSMLQLLRELGVTPDAVAGHSYGEVVALHAAGVIESAEDMLAVSRKRGELMQAAAATPGAMLAVAVSQAEAEQLLGQHGFTDLAVANINTPRQVVVAGETPRVEALAQALKSAGVTCSRLPVATAFHTGIVADSAQPFADFLAKRPIGAPAIPVYGNTHAKPYPEAPDAVRATLAAQLAKPVRFSDMVEQMYADGCRLFVEVGPGATLTAMAQDILAGRPHVAVSLDHRKLDSRATLLNALGVLSINGVAVDYAAFWKPFAEFEAPPEAKSPASVELSGANYGKPYPAEGVRAPPPNPERVPDMRTPTAIAQPAPAPSVAPALSDNGWQAFQAMQQNMLEAQKAFTQALQDSHQAFLRASETSLLQLAQLGGGAPGVTLAPAAPAFAPTLPAVVVPSTRPAPPPAVIAATPAPAPAPAPAPVAPMNAQALLFAVVAEKTGYPQEILTLDMELEAGLGIDSIKRVQILSALQEKLPQLAGVDPQELSRLNTLGEIVAYADRFAGAAPAASASAPAAPPVAALDAQALLFAVVAEKTGYPREILTLDMELEAGLGIDSIKRVQILSALQEQLPQLAAVDPQELSRLNTLGEIVAFAEDFSAPAPPSLATVGAIDAEALLFAVVAEKTGYPREILTLDMELEAGLGIDSIKRVQILSALQEQLPQLASVDPQELSRLDTLGEIVAFARQATGACATVAAPAPKPSAAGLELRVVEAADTPAPGLATPGLFDADKVWIVGGPAAVAEALADRLSEAGVPATAAPAMPADARAAVILTGLSDAEGAAACAALNEAVFAQISACAETMHASGQLLVTVQPSGSAWAAGIAAAAKTAALEWPHASVRALEVETAERTTGAIADALFRELMLGGAELQVALISDGRRLAPTLRSAAMPKASSAPASDGVLVVSGGARGVTAACLAELLSRRPGKVAILGRTPLKDEPASLAGLATDAELKRALMQQHADAGRQVTPKALGAEVREILAQRELRANLDRLSATGAQVRYDAVDVADGAAVAAALARVRAELGSITGLVHAAGVLADKEIRSKTAEQVRAVMATKVDGLRHLLDATAQDDLTAIVCFSSVAAWRGNVGQADYAMANAVLNRVCAEEQARRGGACRVLSIGWGPWAGGMVDAGLEAHFAARGVGLIPLADGARFFADALLGEGLGAVEVLFGSGLTAFAEAPPAEGERTAHVRLHRDTHPWLASHVVRGKPVAPMVLAAELARQAAAPGLPQDLPAGVLDLEVGRGMVLEQFDEAGDLFRIVCSPKGDGRVAVRILNAADGVCYRMTVASEPGPLASDAPATRFTPWPKDRTAYDGRLFHGPDLQVIGNVEGLSEDGAAAGLRRSNADFGTGAPVDLLDGGLQLAVLWAHEQFGRESLPTSAAEIVVSPDWSGAPVRCEAIRRDGDALSSEWTLRFRDEAGALVGRVEGLKMHVLPGAEEASAAAKPSVGVA